jgi:phage tail sheath gpL-like
LEGFVGTSPVKAIGNITITNFNNLVGTTITVGGKLLSEGVEWTTSTSNAVTATSMAAAINTATAQTKCTAVAVGAVVNISANTPGAAGNTTTLVISDGSGMSRSGPTLTGGAD